MLRRRDEENHHFVALHFPPPNVNQHWNEEDIILNNLSCIVDHRCIAGSLPPSPADSGVSDVDNPSSSSSGHSNSDDEQHRHHQHHHQMANSLLQVR